MMTLLKNYKQHHYNNITSTTSLQQHHFNIVTMPHDPEQFTQVPSTGVLFQLPVYDGYAEFNIKPIHAYLSGFLQTFHLENVDDIIQHILTMDTGMGFGLYDSNGQWIADVSRV